jgi:plastocyanin
MALSPKLGRLAIALALSVVALAAALVGSRGETASADEPAHASVVKTVDIVNFAFKPATLTVGAGSKVVFDNTSGTTHTATRNNGFDSGRIKPGKSASIRFKNKGTFRYHCSIHPSMRGKIVVE